MIDLFFDTGDVLLVLLADVVKFVDVIGGMNGEDGGWSLGLVLLGVE